MGICLVQEPFELDLHNDFNFRELEYSVADRSLLLRWSRGEGKWSPLETPSSVCVEFWGVTEFRFQPRDPKMPFTEDDCLNSFGYWTDEEWGSGVRISDEPPARDCLTAIEFQSGAIVIVQATSAHARIEE